MRKLFPTLFFLLLITSCQGQNNLIEGRAYISKKATDKIIVDGNANEESWKNASWTAKFVDIEGDKKPKPYFDTQVKMTWDDTYFYFYAEMEEPHVWAKLTERDAVIFYDNDFEIFIDPDGDTHYYTEFEMNAFNTVWDLLLTRPYRDGGHAIDQFDIPGLQSAVQIDGTLNDPSDKDKGWSVEVAIPWASFKETTRVSSPPKNNDIWRVNFSRVQWETEVIDGEYVKKKNKDTGKNLPENNWVWSPQRAIAMHEPEFWGEVIFKENPDSKDDFYADFGSEEVRQVLYDIHRKQIQNKRTHGTYSAEKDSLLSQESFQVGRKIEWLIQADQYRYHVIMQHPFDAGIYWHIDETGRLWKEIRTNE